MITDRRDRIEALLAEAESFEERFRTWQELPEELTPSEIRSGQRAYQSWFARSLEFVPADSQTEFRDMYEGGAFITRIRGFFSAPLTLNALYNPELGDNPFAPDKYQNPFESDFRANLERQRAILVMSIEAVSGDVALLDELAMLFRRFPDYLAVLRAAENPRVPSPSIENEADLQVVVEAILRLHFDDVRPEDYVSKYAGGASRVDFLLRQPGIIIETKMTRPTLTDRKVGEELLVDWARYQRHPDCKSILAVVYDPGRYISNPAGLENDLSHNHGQAATRAIVIR